LENGRQEEKNAEQENKEDAARTSFEEKERGCTVRLFGTNCLKKGTV
jgi:hypothetical protein